MKELELPPKQKRFGRRPMMIYVTDEMRQAIERKANREDKSLAQAVRDLLNDAINKGLDNESKSGI